MLKLKILFLSLALLFVTFGINISSYLYLAEGTATISFTNFSFEGKSYSLVKVAGRETFLIKDDAFVKEKDDVERALKGNCFSTSYPSKSDLDDIKAKILSLNATRNTQTQFGPAEETCMKLIGQDRNDCYDKDSCRAACYAMYSCMMMYQAKFTQFLDVLTEFAILRHVMNGNVSNVLEKAEKIKAVQTVDQLNFNVSEAIRSMNASITSLQNASTNMSNNKLFLAENQGGYYFCPKPILNTTALSIAATKVSGLATKAVCFDDVVKIAGRVINETNARIDYYTGERRKIELQNKYDELMRRYNNLSENATEILELFVDQNIIDFATVIENRSTKFLGHMGKKEIDLAASELSIIDAKVQEFESHLSQVTQSFSMVKGSKENASSTLEMVELSVGKNGVYLSELGNLKEKYKGMETELSKKITYENASFFASEFASIAGNTSLILERRMGEEAERAPSVLASAMRSISVSVLDAISLPLGIKEAEKRVWMAYIPLIVLVVFDIVVLTIAFLLFFILVWRKTNVYLKSKILKTWGIIFVVLIGVLIVLTFAVNEAVAKEAGEATFFGFLKEAKSAQEIVLLTDRKGTENATQIEDCAKKISGAFSILNKTASNLSVIDGICNSTMTVSECISLAGNKPLVKLKYGEKKAAFYTFYKVEAELEGDSAFFTKCVVADLIK